MGDDGTGEQVRELRLLAALERSARPGANATISRIRPVLRPRIAALALGAAVLGSIWVAAGGGGPMASLSTAAQEAPGFAPPPGDGPAAGLQRPRQAGAAGPVPGPASTLGAARIERLEPPGVPLLPLGPAGAPSLPPSWLAHPAPATVRPAPSHPLAAPGAAPAVQPASPPPVAPGQDTLLEAEAEVLRAVMQWHARHVLPPFTGGQVSRPDP
jgi:hypothetical protein